MFLDWQLPAALAFVAGAGCYLVWQTWRTWAAKKNGCGGSCGCTAKKSVKESTPLVSPQELLSRVKQKR